MSRIGKQPITLPKGVDVKVQGRMLTVKGAKGTLSWEHPYQIAVEVDKGVATVTRSSDLKKSRACHGLTRSLLNNMVQGVSQGYTRVLEIVGVGYRAQVQGSKINLSLGFSHPVVYNLPEGITAEVDKKQVQLTLTGIDKQRIGQAAAEIRRLRPPDAYKGKGIRYQGERIKLKAGKAAK